MGSICKKGLRGNIAMEREGSRTPPYAQREQPFSEVVQLGLCLVLLLRRALCLQTLSSIGNRGLTSLFEAQLLASGFLLQDPRSDVKYIRCTTITTNVINALLSRKAALNTPHVKLHMPCLPHVCWHTPRLHRESIVMRRPSLSISLVLSPPRTLASGSDNQHTLRCLSVVHAPRHKACDTHTSCTNEYVIFTFALKFTSQHDGPTTASAYKTAVAPAQGTMA